MKCCCDKVAFREWLEQFARCKAKFDTFLEEAEDSDEFDSFTIHLLRENFLQLEYDVDMDIAPGLLCDCRVEGF